MPLKWKKNAKIINLDFEVTGENEWLNFSTLVHMSSGVLLFSLVKTTTNIDDRYNVIIMSTLHIIEDYLENASKFSLEGEFGKIINCNNDGFIKPNDEDCLQNFITDNIAFFIGTIIGAYLHKTAFFKQHVGFKVPLFTLIFMLSLITLYCHAKK